MKLAVETFDDKAVDELAKTKASCDVNIMKGYCNKFECKNCDVNKKFMNTFNQLDDYNQLRVYNRYKQNIVSYSILQQDKEENIFKNVVKILFSIIICFILFGFVIHFLSSPSRHRSNINPEQSIMDSYKVYTVPQGITSMKNDYYTDICITLNKTNAYVSDINNDGLVNCIDYAITFKTIWDQQYSKYNCEIVRNYWEGHFNHLFIRVRYTETSPWECIEPQAALMYTGYFYMEDLWDIQMYNPIYNIYGETDYWLSQVRR